MFLRISPIAPNWFLNLSSSIVGVPYSIFLTGSAIGLLPWTYLLVKTGLTLNEIKTLGFDVTNLGSLMALALMALLPTLLNKKLNDSND